MSSSLLAQNTIESTPMRKSSRCSGAVQAMATCTGMELTGSPLPLNHQNAFPLIRMPRTQDGGGPVTDVDPVVQIGRLAMWDEGAEKLVQSNHPNIPQMLGDRDLDGKPDEGFRGMFGIMDVVEVHPPEGIFTVPPVDTPPKDKDKGDTIFYWMQLLNLGYRIPGVVNTDAHYNFHGSGWLRNYIASSTDEPSKISVSEMVKASEQGRIIMSTAPFLQAEVRTGDAASMKRYISGDLVPLGKQPAKLWMRVQCANWYDINRVQVFVNGKAIPELNFTRKSHPDLFSNKTIRFEHTAALPELTSDAHIIVATIGEGLKLTEIMGPDRKDMPPTAVANPIYLDVDGNGFQPNRDNLGVPFMIKE
ncbi:MAG: CehA/McbA family metallohydrolase [Pirellulales bacterium]